MSVLSFGLCYSEILSSVTLCVKLPVIWFVLKVIKHAKGILQRRYLALVIGSPRQQEGLISVPLGKVRVLLDVVTVLPVPDLNIYLCTK